ncbi:MAG: hypothetical protein ACMXYM_01990 [Candidatus Woesearchaeota archaeon]
MKIAPNGVHEERPLYDVRLTRREFDELCAGLPQGPLHGSIGTRHFFIDVGIGMSTHWRTVRDEYWFSIGVEATTPGPDASKQEWDRHANDYYRRLEDAINNSGVRPIKDKINLFGEPKDIFLGYAQTRVEPKTEAGTKHAA